MVKTHLEARGLVSIRGSFPQTFNKTWSQSTNIGNLAVLDLFILSLNICGVYNHAAIPYNLPHGDMVNTKTAELDDRLFHEK
jgi:hypothetical protein